MAGKMDEAAKRRVRAGRLLLKGKKPAEVATIVGAPRQTVYRWLGVLQEEGIDESSLSERPTWVRTWAPKGQTPVIQFHFDWKQLSMIAGVGKASAYFRLHEGTIKKTLSDAQHSAPRSANKQSCSDVTRLRNSQ